MLPRVWMLPWAPWTHCSTPSSDNTTGQLVMSFALVAMSGDTYPYMAYLMNLLSYRCDAKETWLRHLEGLQTDEDGKYDDAQEDIGLISCWGMVAGCTRTCCCKSDWCQTMWMSVWCCHVASLMDFGGKPESHVCIKEVILDVGKSRSSPPNGCTWKRSWLLQGPNTR